MRTFQEALVSAKNVSADAGAKRCGFNPWVRKIPWKRVWQPTPVSYLENPMDRGAWQYTVHGFLHRVGHDWSNLASNRRTSHQSPYLGESDKLTPRCKLVQSPWKTLWRFLKQLKIELTYELVIPFLGICLEEIIIWKNPCTPIFIAALFTIAKTKKHFKCPLRHTCIGLP